MGAVCGDNRTMATVSAACFVALCCVVYGDAEAGEQKAESRKLKLDVRSLYMPDGCDRMAATGDKLTVHYTGRLWDTGEAYDTNYERGKTPFTFNLGMAEVIKGWELGMVGMCVGETRLLTLPPEFAYGEQGTGSIPANAGLEFDVELLKIEEGLSPRRLFDKIDLDGDGHVDKEEIREWLMEGARLKASPAEVRELEAQPDLLDDAIGNILRMEDKDRNGSVEWEEVREKWTANASLKDEL